MNLAVREIWKFEVNGNPPIRYNTTKEEDIQKVDNKVFTEGESEYDQELKNAISNWEKNAEKATKR